MYPTPGYSYPPQPSAPQQPPPYHSIPPAQPYPGQPHPAQPYPGQPHPAQPYPAQPHPAQPYPAQPYPAQPHPAQPYPAQSYPAQPFPAQPAPAYPAQPAPAYPAQPAPAYPAQPRPAQPYPAQPYPAQPAPGHPVAQPAYPVAQPAYPIATATVAYPTQPSAGVQWTRVDFTHHHFIPHDAVIGGPNKHGAAFYIARVQYGSSQFIGRASVAAGGALIPINNQSLLFKQFEVLTAPDHIRHSARWIPVNWKKLHLHMGMSDLSAYHGAMATDAGRPLWIARVGKGKKVIPGQASSHLGGCQFITPKNRVMIKKRFHVLTFNAHMQHHHHHHSSSSSSSSSSSDSD